MRKMAIKGEPVPFDEKVFVSENDAMKKNIAKEILKLGVLFISIAVALGFFASIGIWAAVSFLKFFGIETL
jgi:hypothetical protein